MVSASHEARKRPLKGAQKPWFLGSFWPWEGGLRGWVFETEGLKIQEVQNK